MMVDVMAVFAVVVLAVLRLGVPILAIWLLSKALQHLAPSPS